MKFPWPWFFRDSARSQETGRVGHLTFAHSRVGRTVSRTSLFLKRQLWIFPLLAIVALSVIGFTLRGTIEHTMQENVRSQLQTLLDVETSMLKTWLATQQAEAESHANDERVRTLVYDALNEEESAEQPESNAAASHELLKKELVPRLAKLNYHSYMVMNQNGEVISADDASAMGRTDLVPQIDAVLKRVMDGETVVLPPFPSRMLLKDENGDIRSGLPVMQIIAPIRDASFRPIAAVAFRVRPEEEFTKILQLGRIGQSGETYAFDLTGRMVSNSRFDTELMLLGLLVDDPSSHSILQIQLRNPGGNMVEGFRSKVRRAELPMTKPVAEAIAGRDGVDVLGYPDYRGVPVLGAWTVLPNYGLGVATEIDYAEAYRPMSILRWTFWGLFALLAVASLAIFIFSLALARTQREAQKAALASQKLGQYTLQEKLGAGGMGTVYRGQHAILRRPTAIKVLQLERISEASIERFEREVQITCQLNHPNTVQIYDYGHTPEGLFYYAMEYLDGIDLQKLVEKFGPQSEGRVIRILQQICGSLYEAHSLGMVHRDIKPANIMLNRRGGEPDVVKVLDFGLVKALDETKQQSLTAAGSLTGTPLYMSPEAIQTPNGVDPRSDLYAVGAVGYFLLTGKPVFDVPSVVELCRLHVSETPVPPSERLGKPVSPELEAALLSCLEKPRSKRPQTARDLSLLLARASTANAWQIEEAELWWSQFNRNSLKSSSGNLSGLDSATNPVEKTIIANN